VFPAEFLDVLHIPSHNKYCTPQVRKIHYKGKVHHDNFSLRDICRTKYATSQKFITMQWTYLPLQQFASILSRPKRSKMAKECELEQWTSQKPIPEVGKHDFLPHNVYVISTMVPARRKYTQLCAGTNCFSSVTRSTDVFITEDNGISVQPFAFLR